MKIVIPTHNRPDNITALDLFPEATVYFHNDEQKERYLERRDIKNYVVTNAPVGMSYMRNAVLDTIPKGEWFLSLDDNIRKITGVQGEQYNSHKLHVKHDKSLKADFEHLYTSEQFLKKCAEMVKEAEKAGARYCGFATTNNFFFREKKYRYSGYVIGRAFLCKNDGLRWDENVKAMDDFSYSAQNLLRYGVVLINNYICPHKKHYDVGGIGTKEQRNPMRVGDIEYLVKKYRGLFTINKKEDVVDLLFRLKSTKKIEEWRKWMQINNLMV